MLGQNFEQTNNKINKCGATSIDNSRKCLMKIIDNQKIWPFKIYVLFKAPIVCCVARRQKTPIAK